MSEFCGLPDICLRADWQNDDGGTSAERRVERQLRCLHRMAADTAWPTSCLCLV